MYTVGEFSRLARVSKRLLRYYDEIGLFRPERTDAQTGYRYYLAEQLPRLNRILALKDLGLTLDQIQRTLSASLSTEEMEGMLRMRKAEIERQLQAGLQQIRTIEARLLFLKQAEAHGPLDVVIKSVAAQPALSVRVTLPSLHESMHLFGQVAAAWPARSGVGPIFAILHSEGFDDGPIDVEIGRTVRTHPSAPIALRDGLRLSPTELPAVDEMATAIVGGPSENLLVGYSAIALWADARGMSLAGVPREIALQLPERPDWSDALAEIQYPVARAPTT